MDSRIASAFRSGALLPPTTEHPDLVHVARALAKLAGVQRFDTATPPIARMLEFIDKPRHVIFVLLDGLGMNLLERLPSKGFLRTNLRMQLRATSPSTTACALTSIATGAWPTAHGVTGWYTHVPTHGVTITTLHMTERFSGRSLAECGLDQQTFLPLPAYHHEMSAAPLSLLPAVIADTAFARYSRGNTQFSPYLSLANAAEQVLDFVGRARGSTHIHWYVPDVDSTCHQFGLGDKRTTGLLFELDELLTRLSRALPRDARLVITADHGLLDVPHDGHLPLTGEDPLMTLLDAPPSGDGRMPIFHVRSDSMLDFSRIFDEQFGDAFALLSREEAEQLELFGPGAMCAVSRERFGDFIGIALGPILLHYEPHRAPPPQHVYVAQHAGLTPDELQIPLIVA